MVTSAGSRGVVFVIRIIAGSRSVLNGKHMKGNKEIKKTGEMACERVLPDSATLPPSHIFSRVIMIVRMGPRSSRKKCTGRSPEPASRSPPEEAPNQRVDPHR